MDSTGGLLYVDDLHVGYTCEDQRQEFKVPEETCIPVGRYQVVLRNEGGMNVRYTERFSFHRGMLHLLRVPDFSWVYFHVGNDDDDTSGCILVGLDGSRSTKGEYTVGRSVIAYTDLYKLIYAAIKSGEEVWVEVA